MTVFANILIFQPAAIGDVMLATPVAKALKLNYPDAKITYWGHSSLRELLLSFCPYIDEYVDYDRRIGLISLVKTFWSVNCDLFVDLSNSMKGMFITAFSNARVHTLAYKKQSIRYGTDRKMHAVENFLATVDSICEKKLSPIFPTIFPEGAAQDIFLDILKAHEKKELIGIVPGVGKLRPHRAWYVQGWCDLLETISQKRNCLPILIGGPDEIELGKKLTQAFSGECLNFIGKLSLLQTTDVLKQCQLVISGDTGPAHMAVAVGTPVIGLYGPTYPERSGPYGYEKLVINQSANCACHRLKYCRYNDSNDQSGECMHRITASEILDRLNEALSSKLLSSEQ